MLTLIVLVTPTFLLTKQELQIRDNAARALVPHHDTTHDYKVYQCGGLSRVW